LNQSWFCRRIATGIKPALIESERGPEAALEELVRAYVDVVLDNADMNACYVLESRTLEPEFGEPLRRKERALRETWEKRLLAVRPELARQEARARVQMAVFSVLALCLHQHRVSRDTLAEQATTFVLGALLSAETQPSKN